MIYIRNNQRKEGIEALVTAHLLDPEEIDTMLKLSEIYLRDDHTVNEAEKYANMALNRDPSLPEAMITLGRIYEK